MHFEVSLRTYCENKHTDWPAFAYKFKKVALVFSATLLIACVFTGRGKYLNFIYHTNVPFLHASTAKKNTIHKTALLLGQWNVWKSICIKLNAAPQLRIAAPVFIDPSLWELADRACLSDNGFGLKYCDVCQINWYFDSITHHYFLTCKTSAKPWRNCLSVYLILYTLWCYK